MKPQGCVTQEHIDLARQWLVEGTFPAERTDEHGVWGAFRGLYDELQEEIVRLRCSLAETRSATLEEAATHIESEYRLDVHAASIRALKDMQRTITSNYCA